MVQSVNLTNGQGAFNDTYTTASVTAPAGSIIWFFFTGPRLDPSVADPIVTNSMGLTFVKEDGVESEQSGGNFFGSWAYRATVGPAQVTGTMTVQFERSDVAGWSVINTTGFLDTGPSPLIIQRITGVHSLDSVNGNTVVLPDQAPQANSEVIGFFGNGNFRTYLPGTGYLEIGQGGNNRFHTFVERNSGAPSQTLTYTPNGTGNGTYLCYELRDGGGAVVNTSGESTAIPTVGGEIGTNTGIIVNTTGESKALPRIQSGTINVAPGAPNTQRYIAAAPLGNNANDGLSELTPKENFNAIWPDMQPGDFLNVLSDLPDLAANAITTSSLLTNLGTEENPLTIRGDNPWVRRLFSSFDVSSPGTVAHIHFRDLIFDKHESKALDAARTKIIRCGMLKGGQDGNGKNFVGGSNQVVEQCFFGDGGGRYQHQYFEASNVAVRKNLYVKCGGWTNVPEKVNPDGAFIYYGTSDSLLHNNIALDCVKTSASANEAFGCFSVNTNDALFPSNNNILRGNVIHNSPDFRGYHFDGFGGVINNVVMDHCVSNNAGVGMQNGVTTSSSMTINNCIFSNHITGNGLGMNSNGAKTIVVRNSIVFNNNVGLNSLGVPDEFDDDYLCLYNNNNQADTQGPNNVDYSPLSNGLRWPMWIDAPPNPTDPHLANDGTNGLPIGPRLFGDVESPLQYMYGTPESYADEPNSDIATSQKMWPFPNEDEMLLLARNVQAADPGTDFETIGGDRGFATTGLMALDGNPMTVTRYVAEMYGNPTPAGIYAVSQSTGGQSKAMPTVGGEITVNVTPTISTTGQAKALPTVRSQISSTVNLLTGGQSRALPTVGAAELQVRRLIQTGGASKAFATVRGSVRAFTPVGQEYIRTVNIVGTLEPRVNNNPVKEMAGDSFKMNITLQDNFGTFIDIPDDWRVDWQLAQTVNSTSPMVSRSTQNDSIQIINNAITFTVTNIETQNIKAGVYYHECRIIDSAGNETTVVRGNFTIEANLIKI